jgi:hypothetical protein
MHSASPLEEETAGLKLAEAMIYKAAGLPFGGRKARGSPMSTASLCPRSLTAAVETQRLLEQASNHQGALGNLS